MQKNTNVMNTTKYQCINLNAINTNALTTNAINTTEAIYININKNKTHIINKNIQ